MAKPVRSLAGTAVAITGGARGIGRATAAALIAQGARVAIGDIDAALAERTAGELAAGTVGLPLDVTDRASFAAFLDQAEDRLGPLDVLINNAGIESRGVGNSVIGAAEVTAEHMREVFETNVFGMVRVTHAFLPLLLRSPAPVVVNVGSGLGSLTRVADASTPAYGYPGVAYPASKATVNMITVQFAKAFPAMRINVVEPGFTKTDLNGNTGVQSVEEGAEIIVRMAQVGSDGPTGGYFDAAGPLPW
jgi:NAD(P)-dependent dehydrogenase (short-subunit alcohol dehydrogenase family)